MARSQERQSMKGHAFKNGLAFVHVKSRLNQSPLLQNDLAAETGPEPPLRVHSSRAHNSTCTRARVRPRSTGLFAICNHAAVARNTSRPSERFRRPTRARHHHIHRQPHRRQTRCAYRRCRDAYVSLLSRAQREEHWRRRSRLSWRRISDHRLRS